MHKAPDPEDLREDLMQDIIQLQGELKRLGYDMVYIPDFLKETRALALDVQIQKLRKQIDRMRKIIKNAPSNSTTYSSAFVSTLAPSSEGAAQMVVMINGGEKVVVKRGRPQDAVRESSPLGNEGTLVADAREKKRRSFSRDFPLWYDHTHSLVCAFRLQAIVGQL